jgi:hypothetical protein
MYSIFNSVGRLVPAFSGKELYVLKRLDSFVANEQSYQEQGFLSQWFDGK